MLVTINELTKNVNKANLSDVLSCWLWKIRDMQAVVTISAIGDVFLLGKDQAVYWLQTDSGDLNQVAESLEQFQDSIIDPLKVDEWFLPMLVESLIANGKILKSNEVYSCKIPPMLGGEYDIDNIVPTDMGIHFAFTGQICQQVKGLPDNAKVNIRLQKVV